MSNQEETPAAQGVTAADIQPAIDDATPAAAGTKPQAGRFIENISTDGSRASAEDQPQPLLDPTTSCDTKDKDKDMDVPETEMRAVRSTPFRRVSRKSRASVQIQRSNSTSNRTAPGQGQGQGQQYNTPSTENSTKHQSSSSGGDHENNFAHRKGVQRASSSNSSNKDEEGGDAEEGVYHRTLTALYPLTHFVGFRPLSHPHTPSHLRLRPSDTGFNRFHYLCGRLLSFGLTVTGEPGALARYRNPTTNQLELVRMYKAQSASHLVDSLHTVVAAFGIIALLSLLSRSPFHRSHRSPLIIGAFATEAVVTFHAYRTPLAQPKSILIGNTLSSVIGVAIQLAFSSTSYSVSGVYGIDWAAAATSVAAAVLAMELLGVAHPPGAAFALLSVTSVPTERLGWWLVPITVIGSLVVIGWGLVINNLGGRRWPENWLYKGGMSEVPVIGPERLPFMNSSIEWPRRRVVKRKRGAREEEKGFYRVPNSGTKLNTPYTTALKPPTTTTAPKTSNGATAAAGAGEDGRTIRASQLTKVDSTPPPQPTTPAVVVSRMIEDPTLTATGGVERNNSKGSKRSRRSVVVHVNENVRRMSTGAASATGNGKGKAKEDVPAVPAIQWRSPE